MHTLFHSAMPADALPAQIACFNDQASFRTEVAGLVSLDFDDCSAAPEFAEAFGVDFSAEGLDPAQALRAGVNGRTVTVPAPSAGAKPAHVFAGFLCTTPITQISFSGSDLGPILFGICYGYAQSVLAASPNSFASPSAYPPERVLSSL